MGNNELVLFNNVDNTNEDENNIDLSLDWDEVFDDNNENDDKHVESISDGLVMSLNNLGKVDIEYIASLTNKDKKEVIHGLKGSIYQNPLKWDECYYKGWETSEEYLSGNILIKLRQAQKANELYGDYFKDNVDALLEILPEGVKTGDIYVTIGSPFLPSHIIDDFIAYILGDNKKTLFVNFLKTIHDEKTGKWNIPFKSSIRNSIYNENVYGTKEMKCLNVIEHLLNAQPIIVKEKIIDKTKKCGYNEVTKLV